MKNLLIITFTLVFATTLNCSAQDFLKHYRKLKTENLPAFFNDWKQYSDSIAAHKHTPDSVYEQIFNDQFIVEIFEDEVDDEKDDEEDDYEYYEGFLIDGEESKAYVEDFTGRNFKPIFKVVPQTIKVHKWDMSLEDVDSIDYIVYNRFGININSPFDLDYYKMHTTDRVTYKLPENGLYLTDNIYNTIAKFIGGQKKKNGKYTKTNKQHRDALRKYIPVVQGHWGGYWHLITFPTIEYILRLNNLISVSRRTSWCSGDEIWYRKQDNGYTRDPDSKGSWME